MTTIQIRVVGNGTVRSSGGDNPLAVRNSINVPYGYNVYFEADPNTGAAFQTFTAADGTETTQNPFTVQALVDGSITAYFSGSERIYKELVTNLTDNETIIDASVFATSDVLDKPQFIRKYQEGNNWVFLYSFETHPDVMEFGAGAGLGQFIATNWRSIAALLAILGVAVIVWAWREPDTQKEIVAGKLTDNSTALIQKCLLLPSRAERETCLNSVQQIAIETTKASAVTDWGMVGLGIAVILGAAYVLGSRK